MIDDLDTAVPEFKNKYKFRSICVLERKQYIFCNLFSDIPSNKKYFPIFSKFMNKKIPFVYFCPIMSDTGILSNDLGSSRTRLYDDNYDLACNGVLLLSNSNNRIAKAKLIL